MRLSLLLLAACATTPNDGGFSSDDGGTPILPGDNDGGFGGKDDAKAPVAEEVFGQSATTLYRLNPTTKAVTRVGDFSGCGPSITDIAVNESGAMFGTAEDALYSIDKNTAACALIARGTYPNSLSFLPNGIVPKGATGAGSSFLVGFENADYVRIDTATGKMVTIQAKALRTGLESSGDIVSVKDGPTYLTVKASGNGTSCKGEDCLVELNPVTGQITANYNQIGYTRVFGLAFWAGKIYGFTEAGSLVEMGISGTTVNTKLISIPNPPAGLQFYGAGSTTSAPVGPS
jgi:hypothetical protein